MATFFPALHALASAAVAVILLLLQSYGLASSSSGWMHADLLAIYVFYVGLEHHAFSGTVKIVFISLLEELWSSVPAGFYLTSHLLMMLVGNRLATWLEMQRRSTQLLLFGVLLSMKEGMFVLTLTALGLPVSASGFFHERLPGMLITMLVAVPVMEILSFMDGFFDRLVASRPGGAPAGGGMG